MIFMNLLSGREYLTNKTIRAFDIVHSEYNASFDWFVRADDDTYLILENLRHMLVSYSPLQPISFGHHFKTIVKQG